MRSQEVIAASVETGSAAVLHSVERLAQSCVAGIGLRAISAVFEQLSVVVDSGVSCPREESHSVRVVGRRSKRVRTLLGSVQVTRGYYQCRSCRVGFAAVDDVLGITGTSLSPGLVKAAAVAGREMSYAKAGEFIHEVTGLDLASTATLARATRGQGTRARTLIGVEHEQAGPPPVGRDGQMSGPDKCYVVLDGTGVPMLPGEVVGRKGKNGHRAGTREVKIGCFFTQSGIDPVSGEPVQDDGSVSYVSTFDPADAFGHQCVREFWRRGLDRVRQPIVIGDGAHWIWNIAAKHFPAATEIVDYFHAREHLSDLMKLLTGVVDDACDFEQGLVDQLDIGNTAGIAAAVDRLDLSLVESEVAKSVATEVSYFTRNHHRMQYADFKANGYYIGSGPVEAACNTIVKQRAKRAGMHWTIAGLDPVIALRTVHQSGRDEILWPEPQI